MRKIIEKQLKFGQVDISRIEIDLNSRDEIPQLLLGLQAIYTDKLTRSAVFSILQEIIPEDTDTRNGRPGMELWSILVLGTLRLNCNLDFDKLLDIANNHKKVREFLGHTIHDFDQVYALQTLKDNVSLFTPAAANKISQVVINAGHKLFGCQTEPLKGRCDSFVVETNVHFPTDISLLWDAIRKVIMLLVLECDAIGITEWRQKDYILKKIKRFFNRARRLKRSTAKSEKRKEKNNRLMSNAHQEYVNLVAAYLGRAKLSVAFLKHATVDHVAKIMIIESFIAHAERQIDQILRRAVKGENIPHDEKVFSVFEEHTEWISKGKAGVPQELGLKVCILEDQHRFILHHYVIQNQTDDQIAVKMVSDTREKFAELSSCSFDKGFHSPKNQEELKPLLEKVVLPRKGRLTAEAIDIEHSDEFIHARHLHAAVESAINALENHGLDRCPDHGIAGFERYVALAVLARNLQILGAMLQKRAVEKLKRQEKKASRRIYRFAA